MNALADATPGFTHGDALVCALLSLGLFLGAIYVAITKPGKGKQ